MIYLSKYETAKERFESLIAGGKTELEAREYIRDNIGLYQLKPNVDTPQDRELMNTQFANAGWYSANIVPKASMSEDSIVDLDKYTRDEIDQKILLLATSSDLQNATNSAAAMAIVLG